MRINWKINTALFMTGQALSLFGSMVVQYAIMWHITLETQSGTMMTVFTVVGFLPMFLISPFGGVWADRFNRKYIINIADGGIAAASLIVALFILSGTDSVWILLFCSMVRSLGQGVQTPAVGAFIPQIVPAERLTRINGIQGSVQSFIALSAPFVSGALMSFAPLWMLFFLDVVTAVIGISVLFFFVKVPAAEKSERKKLEYFGDLKAGIGYMRKRRYIVALFVLSAAFMFFASPAMMLTPLQVTRNFGDDAWRLAAVEITFSVGMMAGGVLIGAWGGFKNRVFTMSLACALFGVCTAGLGLTSYFSVYNVIMALIGLTLPLYNAPVMTLLQTTVDPEFMGRVLSVIMMLNSVMVPMGMLVFGPVSDRLSINIILVGTGAVTALLCVPFAANRSLREAGGRVN
jgi:DHA3 family macrolide efflux protein-like MFS transporter